MGQLKMECALRIGHSVGDAVRSVREYSGSHTMHDEVVRGCLLLTSNCSGKIIVYTRT